MKNIAVMVVNIMLGVLLLLIVLSISGRMNRSVEIESNLASVAEETVENAAENPKYCIQDTKEFVADFTEHLSERLDATADLCVEVEQAGEQEGILAVKVTESFSHPNGRTGKVSSCRTVIFDKPQEEEQQEATIRFYSSREEMEQGGICYKFYCVKKGEKIIPPLKPEKEGKVFDGWRLQDGSEGDVSSPVEQDRVYYAAWK